MAYISQIKLSDTTYDISAIKLKNARKINLTGAVTGSVNFDGSSDVSIATTVNHNHDSSYLKYSGWWNSDSGQKVNDASGMVFAYSSHGLPGYWGIVTTFDYYKGSAYRHQIYGDGWKNEMYFRTCSSDRGGWNGWRHLLDDSNYTSYTVKKDGSGASGTWGINITGNADTTDGLHVHSGRNNEANKIVRTDGSGYIQCGYINSSSGNEGNNSSPPRVWGTNGSDNYLRTYLTSALSVGYAASAGSVAWANVSGKPSSYTPSSHSHSNITYTDTRSDNQSPDATVGGLSVHLKANGTDSLSDGGTYHAILNVKDWGDYSGGPYWQATVTANDNMYYRRSTSGTAWGSWRKVWARGDAVTGAVWNDYAECRESDCEEFGYVLMETGDDSLTKTTERLSHFAGVSSDTWGFSQGETDKAKTPIAVAGRVLVYPYQDRNNYKPGDCVCAAPGGTVDIMTREEVREWPDRIVGTVSCVPNYEEWGGGEGADRDPVKVNGRIWIKVK